ncbi:hypothetical protein CSUI_008435, partial [Cystoisospora suis]
PTRKRHPKVWGSTPGVVDTVRTALTFSTLRNRGQAVFPRTGAQGNHQQLPRRREKKERPKSFRGRQRQQESSLPREKVSVGAEVSARIFLWGRRSVYSLQCDLTKSYPGRTRCHSPCSDYPRNKLVFGEFPTTAQESCSFARSNVVETRYQHAPRRARPGPEKF